MSDCPEARILRAHRGSFEAALDELHIKFYQLQVSQLCFSLFLKNLFGIWFDPLITTINEYKRDKLTNRFFIICECYNVYDWSPFNKHICK